MAEPIAPEFAQSGAYLKYYGSNVLVPLDTVKRFRYIRLLQSESPLRYPYTFPSLTTDSKSAQVNFSDLDPASGHIYQAFIGVQPGTRLQIWHPFDTRILNFDTNTSAISADQTAILTHGLSPYEAPSFNVWILPNKLYPGIVAQNATAELLGFPGGKSILPQLIWLIASFKVEPIEPATHPDIFDMLEKKKIPSTPVMFGGTIRSIPR